MVSFNDAVGLSVVWAGSGMFEALCICEGEPFLGVIGLSVVCEDFRGVPSRQDSSVRWSVTAAMVLQDIWKRNGYFEKKAMTIRHFLLPTSMKLCWFFLPGSLGNILVH